MFRSNENYKNSLNDFLINNNVHKLSNSEKALCDQPIAEKEILNSLKQLHNGKTMGTVGLPTGFYKSLLIESIKYTIETGEMSIEQRRGIITLLPPKNKNLLDLKKLESNIAT